MDKIRMGLIGCGNMMRQHLSGVDQVKAVEFTAVCDVVRENAERMSEVLGGTFVTTDWREMADKVDAVLVALPHDLHFECGLFFARHGKHVLMEKPLCNTEEECRRLIAVCKEEGVVLMCAYPVPHYPGVRKLYELVKSGEYGAVMQMSVWTEQLTRKDELHWLSTARIGGGQFFSHGCHYVDLLLRFLGTPVRGFHLGTNAGTPWMLREGTSAVVLQFESGALAYHGATWGARGTRLGWDIQVQTEKGMLEYSTTLDGARIFLYDQLANHRPGVEESSKRQVVWELSNDGGNAKFTHFEIDHFADCVLNGKKPVTDGETSLKSLQLIWKLYEAERTGIVPDLRGFAIPEADLANYSEYVASLDRR
ncbi:MAG: Gfo/Idh/MocA family oxidoreductase [Kiritimatiellae bacterium]|nr:Gfo/Idh/MocA family oxidoreductase [Kiritimatiellia bacterium]